MASPDAHPESAPGSLTPRGRVRTALSRGWQRLSEVAHANVPTFGDRDSRAGEHILAVRYAKVRLQALMEVAVAVEVASGADWDQVADALGMGWTAEAARRAYGEKVARWGSNEPAPHGPVLADGSTVDGVPAVEEITWATVVELDAWWLRTVDPQDAVAIHPDRRRDHGGRLISRTTRPVSGELY